MELWIPLTIAAAFFQNIRSAMQKHLQGKLSTLGAAYVRFLYAVPVALIYLVIVLQVTAAPLPEIDARFLWYALAGGVCQILFTTFLLWLFSFHNFAVGTTEVVSGERGSAIEPERLLSWRFDLHQYIAGSCLYSGSMNAESL